MKMILPTQELAGNHYSWDDIGVRHGEEIRNGLIAFITESPVIALVLEGSNAIAVVRKICGSTEPSSANPGTIRGDFSHHNYAQCNIAKKSIRNVIHASADKADAAREIPLWFRPEEIQDYRINDETEHYLF
jgi:nucleoside-diphosphate kinase